VIAELCDTFALNEAFLSAINQRTVYSARSLIIKANSLSRLAEWSAQLPVERFPGALTLINRYTPNL
jgi:hypothetical protein